MVSAQTIQTKVCAAVAKVGTTAVFTVVTGGSYDPSTGLKTGQTTATFAVRTSPPVSWRVFYKSQSTTEKEGTSVIVLPVPVAGLAFTPTIGMAVTCGGVSWVVQAVKPAMFQDTIVAWDLEVSNG